MPVVATENPLRLRARFSSQLPAENDVGTGPIPVTSAIAVLGLVALLFGGGLFNPAAAPESEPTITATKIIPLVILVVMFVVATKWPLNIGVPGR